MRTTLTGNGIGFARIECDNTVNLIRSFTCKLFSDRLCSQLLLFVWVLYIINRQYSIGRYLFKPTCVHITNNDAIVRISHTYTATIRIWYKSPTKNIHLAFILLHGCPLYHTCLAVHTCIYHRIALFHPSVYIITHALNHSVIHLLGVEVVYDGAGSFGIACLTCVPRFIQPVHRITFKGFIVRPHNINHLLTLVVKHVLCVIHFLWGCDIVAVQIALVHRLHILILFSATLLCECAEVEAAQVQRVFHILQYGCFFLGGEFLVFGDEFRHFPHILVGGKVKSSPQRLPYFIAEHFVHLCVRFIHAMLHGSVVCSRQSMFSCPHQPHRECHSTPNITVELSSCK